MDLAGQGERRAGGEAGYAMAALLVSVAVMGVLMAAAMPVWRHQARREKEAELIFRGEQYARAIALYQRKLPGAFPANIDILVEQRFLRKKYKDPMTEDGEFQVLFAATQPGGGGARGQAGQRGAQAGGGLETGVGVPGSSGAQPPGGAPGAGQVPGVRGGIMGVQSKSTDESIRLYNGRNHYNEWQFLFTAFASQPGGGQQADPGSGQPTGPVMQPGRGRGQRGGEGVFPGLGPRRGGQGPGRGGQEPGRGRGGFGPGVQGPIRPPGGAN